MSKFRKMKEKSCLGKNLRIRYTVIDSCIACDEVFFSNRMLLSFFWILPIIWFKITIWLMRRGYCCFLCQKFKIDGSMTQQTVKMTQSFAIYCMQLHFAFVFFLSIIFSIDFNNQTAMSADGRAENLKLIDRNYAVCEFKSGM